MKIGSIDYIISVLTEAVSEYEHNTDNRYEYERRKTALAIINQEKQAIKEPLHFSNVIGTLPVEIIDFIDHFYLRMSGKMLMTPQIVEVEWTKYKKSKDGKVSA